MFELEDGSVEEVEEETLFKEVSRRILEEQTPEEISKIIDMCENITKVCGDIFFQRISFYSR